MGESGTAAIEAAQAAERRGQPALARRHYEHALRATRTENEAANAAALLRWIGSTYRAEGNGDAALDCYRASLAVARARGADVDVAHALN